MSFQAVLVEAEEGASQRRSSRRALRLRARATSPLQAEDPVTVHNISTTGLLIETLQSALTVNTRLLVELADQESVEARVVWMSDRLLGCEFIVPVSPGTVSAALLRGDPQGSAVKVNAEAGETASG